VELEIVHSELDGVSNHGLTIHHVSATGNFRWNFYTTRFGDLELYTDINSIAPKGHFIAATGEYASLSDARMKKDVENAPEVLSKVLQLDIKKYHFLDNKPEEKKHYGMIAQEVEKIFPEIVYHNLADGSKRDYYTMNYSALGVLAIKAIQEMAKRNDEKNNTTDALQKQIDALKKQNEEQQKQIDELKAVVLKNSQQQGITQHPSADPLSKSIVAFVPSLEQNAPNPFNNSTTIHYILPQKFTNAQIVITDNAGKAVKQINISGAGKGRINVDAATLSSGAYTYSLIVEEKIIGTKKMILAK